MKRSDSKTPATVYTTVQEAFGLTDAEVEMIDCRVGVAKAIRAARRERGLTQPQAAALAGVSQPRISEVERDDDGVSFGLMVEIFFALGKGRRDLAEVLAGDVAKAEPAEPSELPRRLRSGASTPVKRSPRAAKARKVARTVRRR